MSVGDGSLPTLVENWIVDKIRDKLDAVAPIGDEHIEAFSGVEAFAGTEQLIIEELSRKPGVLWVAVRWNGRIGLEQEQEAFDAVSTYIVYCVVQNPRAGAARRGDNEAGGAVIWRGTNYYADQLFQLFNIDEKRPNKNDSVMATERLHVARQEVVQFFPKGFSMFNTVIECREVLVAS